MRFGGETPPPLEVKPVARIFGIHQKGALMARAEKAQKVWDVRVPVYPTRDGGWVAVWYYLARDGRGFWFWAAGTAGNLWSVVRQPAY